MACLDKARETYGAIPGGFYTVRDIAAKSGNQTEEQVRRRARKGEIPGRIPGIRRVLFERRPLTNCRLKAGGSPASPPPRSKKKPRPCAEQKTTSG